MPRLTIRLLGPLQVALDGQPVTGLASDKARALLAYLAVESHRPHRRESLAGLLWADYPQASARASLRSALLALRKGIDDRGTDSAYLHITRQTIQFNRKGDAWVDVRAFTDLVEPKHQHDQTTRLLEEAVALYCGEFIEGFSLRDSAPFEEWALLTREHLRRLAVEILDQLVSKIT